MQFRQGTYLLYTKHKTPRMAGQAPAMSTDASVQSTFCKWALEHGFRRAAAAVAAPEQPGSATSTDCSREVNATLADACLLVEAMVHEDVDGSSIGALIHALLYRWIDTPTSSEVPHTHLLLSRTHPKHLEQDAAFFRGVADAAEARLAIHRGRDHRTT